MAPVIEGKSLNDIKKHKQESKKWKEKKLIKKIDKQKIKESANLLKESNSVEQEEQLEDVSTLTVAVPGSILENAQSLELRTYLAGQIARAACMFQVDEVVVFDDYGDIANTKKATIEDVDGLKTTRHCCIQLGRILQYLECPQYLRKHFFPIHNDLKFAGILNPLDAPHHLRQNNTFTFR